MLKEKLIESKQVSDEVSRHNIAGAPEWFETKIQNDLIRLYDDEMILNELAAIYGSLAPAMYREMYLTDRRFNMISRAKKYVAVLLVFVCVCMIFSPQTAYAAEDSSQHETVKVGFFAMDGYHVMDEEGNRSGYGYDFLRLMARYWDVDYEYVGYDQSWDDMQQMLEDGEIDMVTSPRKTPEREEKFDFSRPIGTNNGILTVRSDNSTIVDGNYSLSRNFGILYCGAISISDFTRCGKSIA